jgi:lysozyme
MSDLTERLVKDLKIREGFRGKVYRCPAGRLTIGYGRNVEDAGITEAEAECLPRNDIVDALADAERLAGTEVWSSLNEPRRFVLASMAFQMEDTGLRKFRRMWAALADHQYDKAMIEMLDSEWALQTPERARDMAAMMQSGQWPGNGDTQ